MTGTPRVIRREEARIFPIFLSIRIASKFLDPEQPAIIVDRFIQGVLVQATLIPVLAIFSRRGRAELCL